jgi:predicted hydrolase (HD superfamily)
MGEVSDRGDAGKHIEYRDFALGSDPSRRLCPDIEHGFSHTRGLDPEAAECSHDRGDPLPVLNSPRQSARGLAILISMKSREEALDLLHRYTRSDSLRKHALAVEHAMKACGARAGEDPVRWGICGLLHDFDYEQFPTAEQHPMVGSKILEEEGFDEGLRRAILGHATYTGVPRDTPMAKALFACDELAGFITACALVQPGKSLAEVKVSSVKKKLKDKAFARSVNRDDIHQGVAELGVGLDEHIEFVLNALKEISPELGLAGADTGPGGAQ